jgi:hypothetical protein
MNEALSRLERRDRVLEAALSHVPFDGWSRKSLYAGAADAGFDAATARLLFPGGGDDLLDHLDDWADRRMLARLDELDLATMRVRERVAAAVRARLEVLAPHREAVRRALAARMVHPDRPVVAVCGDGGFMMSLTELDTAVRLGLPLVVLVYNDHAYGAEVHHFAPEGHPVDIVEFPETDIAAIARGHGCDAVTVRRTGDLQAVQDWVAGPRSRPLVIDARITTFPSWMIAHSFAGEHGDT